MTLFLFLLWQVFHGNNCCFGQFLCRNNQTLIKPALKVALLATFLYAAWGLEELLILIEELPISILNVLISSSNLSSCFSCFWFDFWFCWFWYKDTGSSHSSSKNICYAYRCNRIILLKSMNSWKVVFTRNPKVTKTYTICLNY